MENIKKDNRGVDIADISIIMPVYNTGSILRAAVDGILKQSMTSWELILSDDGSDDPLTLEILEEYDGYDQRIIVKHELGHMGAATARNKGLSRARGKYVIFLDSDDYFSNKLLENLYNSAIDYNVDLVLCNYAHRNGERKDFYKKPPQIPNGVFNVTELDENGLHICGLMPWNKLIKKELLVDNDIKFQNLPSCNDIFFSCMCLLASKSIYYVDSEPLVVWQDGRNGQISKRRKPINLFFAINEVFNKYNNRNKAAIRKNIERQICVPLLRNGIHEMRQSNDLGEDELFLENAGSFIEDRLKDGIQFQDPLNNLLAENYKNKNHTEKWWTDERLFGIQLDAQSDKLFEMCGKYNKIFLWGVGKRGRAFLDFCKNNNVSPIGYTDKAYNLDINNGICLKWYSQDEVLENAEYIICSNNSIISELANIFPREKLFSLETLCPF